METAVIIFSKAPIPGLVKTRLTENTCLNEKDTAIIAEAMLKDTIKLASETKANNIIVGFYPEEGLEILEEIVEKIRIDGFLDKNVLYFQQFGSNFDDRFGSVVGASFKNNSNGLVILGADLPYLDPEIINKTLSILNQKENEKVIVLGPAAGGGIYLVGINANFNPVWFSKYHLFRGGIEISQFVEFCKKKEIELILLPFLNDIDIEEDLVSLITIIEALTFSKDYKGYHFPQYTKEILNNLGLYVIESPGETRLRKIAKKENE